MLIFFSTSLYFRKCLPPYIKHSSLLEVLHNSNCIWIYNFGSYQFPLSKNLFKRSLIQRKTKDTSETENNSKSCQMHDEKLFQIVSSMHLYFALISWLYCFSQASSWSKSRRANTEADGFTDMYPVCVPVLRMEDTQQKTMGPCVFLCWLSH